MTDRDKGAPVLTRDWLGAHGACSEGLDWFTAEYPNGVTSADAEAFAERLVDENWYWALWLVERDTERWAAYRAQVTPLGEAYEAQVGALWEAHQAQVAPLRAAHMDAILTAYGASVAPLREAHWAQVAPLWEAYWAQVGALWEAQVTPLREAQIAPLLRTAVADVVRALDTPTPEAK